MSRTEEEGAQPPFDSVGVAGLGLIGGSVAMALRERWPSVRISACDRPERLAQGRARGLVDHAVGSVEQLAACDLIVLAVPMAEMGALVDALGAAGASSVVTDVGSTKREVIAAAERAGLRRFVGGHPMAGAERAGVEHARADLFLDRAWLFVPGASPDDASRLEQLVRGFGAAPRWMTADAHDRVMAYVSHLPQLLATVLMNVVAEEVGDDGLAAAGPALAEMTRLAASPPDLWRGILNQNADFTDEALKRFADQLPMSADLRTGEWVIETFARAGRARNRWRPTGPR